LVRTFRTTIDHIVIIHGSDVLPNRPAVYLSGPIPRLQRSLLYETRRKPHVADTEDHTHTSSSSHIPAIITMIMAAAR